MIKNTHLCVSKFTFLAALAISYTSTALAEHSESINLDEVNVSAPALDSRIIRYPATVETYNKQQIEDTVNATTSMQTLKYLPSFQVRERYIGDRNGPIATRTTGTLSSAQTMLYADGILLSNLQFLPAINENGKQKQMKK